jgi:Fe-S cluster assembly protein SufD
LEGHQKYSITTRQNHQGRESISDLIVSGIAAEQSDINYQGTIVVEKTAPKANASQENKTILCGSLARAISIPSLEVKINDVQCAHGSAVGPLNQDHMYYVQSRGLLPEHAQRMLLTSFFEQIVSALEDESFRERIMKQLVSRAFVTKE